MVTYESEVFGTPSDAYVHLSILAVRFQVPWVENTKNVLNTTSESLKSLHLTDSISTSLQGSNEFGMGVLSITMGIIEKAAGFKLSWVQDMLSYFPLSQQCLKK